MPPFGSERSAQCYRLMATWYAFCSDWRSGASFGEGRVDADGDVIELITIHLTREAGQLGCARLGRKVRSDDALIPAGRPPSLGRPRSRSIDGSAFFTCVSQLPRMSGPQSDH